MGKIKSAIITALLCAAIIALTLFAVVSCNVPGTNGVKRYNSFVSSIPLGGEYTGEAYAVLYPDGVISVADYSAVMGDDSNEDKKAEYRDTYVKNGGIYVEKDKLGDDEGKAFKESVLADAKILSERFSGKAYSSCSVSVEDGYSIKVTVPTGFTYAEYKSYDAAGRSSALSEISHTVSSLIMDGEISIRNNTEFDESQSLTPVLDDVASYFKGASVFGVAGNFVLRLNLTDDGFDKLNAILTKEGAEGSAYIYVGETNLSLTMTMGTELTEKNMYFSAEKSYAEDYALVLDSVIGGSVLTNKYNGTAPSIIALSPALGDSAAMWLGIFAIAILLISIVCFIIKYRRLGLVQALIIAIYALVIVTASMLLSIQFTTATMLTAVSGLAILCLTNFFVFESVRKETAVGRTVQAAVKTGYKKTLFGILDIHVILIVASMILALVSVGEAAACGLVAFIASIASYVLYWFTRFMWFVISSPARDKFAFGGFRRVEVEDE